MGRVVCILVTLLWGSAAWAAVPKCRALDARDGALILEIANRSAAECRVMLTAAMKQRRCTRAHHPASFEFESQYDHRGTRGTFVTVSCAAPRPPKPAKLPKCRAVDLETKKTIAEAASTGSAYCVDKLVPKVRKAWCTRARRGKRLEFQARFEHRHVRPKRVAMSCKK